MADEANVYPATKPVFGFILFGGAVSGGTVRDVRLANGLAQRGYPVHVWWAMDRPHDSPLREEIHQHWLFTSFRLWGRRFRPALDYFGRLARLPKTDLERADYSQRWPFLLNWSINGLIEDVCNGAAGDPGLVRRFARELASSGVSHLFPNISLLGAYILAARRMLPRKVRFVVTFQGYELFATYARKIGRETELYRRLFEIVEQSDFPAIAVSQDYSRRIQSEIGIPEERLKVIPPGVPIQSPMEKPSAEELVKGAFTDFRHDLPLVSFVGRQDTEKGIDLLLYAANILRRKGCRFQLAVFGPTVFGADYRIACQRIAEHMQCPVFWGEFVPGEVRSAILAVSRCVVYPSIHREPFGMVPVEAMAQGTPCVVPDTGGVSELTRWESLEGGLNFRSWDSGDLACQVSRLLEDEPLWHKLTDNAPRIAAQYSVEKMVDRILEHLHLPPNPINQSNQPV